MALRIRIIGFAVCIIALEISVWRELRRDTKLEISMAQTTSRNTELGIPVLQSGFCIIELEISVVRMANPMMRKRSAVLRRRSPARERPASVSQKPGEPSGRPNAAVPRFFNTAGPCRPEDHSMLPPERRPTGIPPLLAEKACFVVHAPRQSGKTTLVHLALVGYR